MTETPPSRVPWPPLVLLACLIGGLAAGRIAPLPFPGGALGTALEWLGIALGLSAIAIDVWAILTLSRHRTTVMPTRASAALVTAGPFSRSRNPIYLANAVLLAGVGLATGNAWFALAAAILVWATTRLAIVPEEAHLSARFGAAYEAYRARVPRWL